MKSLHAPRAILGVPCAALMALVALSCLSQGNPDVPDFTLLDDSYADAAVGSTEPLPPPKEYPVNEPFSILSDRVVQGDDKEAVAETVDRRPTLRSAWYDSPREWRASEDIAGMGAFQALPTFRAPGSPLLEALYRLSQEEAVKDIREDGAFMAGAKWPGVWTRDLSYAIQLSLAWIMPEASRKSLEAKLSTDGQVIQDTGTGGSWPVSTDRVVWGIAAWELWLATGDGPWLEKAYAVLKATAEKDRAVAYDERTGLYRGETSFLDWREQSYPRWMGPADIYESKALGTNVLHRELNAILGRMARLLGRPAAEATEWERRAADLDRAINARLWDEDRKRYAIFAYPELYGRPLPGVMDSLGNALAVIYGVAHDRRAQSMDLPLVPFGPPTIHPQLSGIPPYHNKSIWPFVTAYRALAAARAGKGAEAAFCLESNVRAAALFLTNKENMTFNTGNDRGTAVNSDRQLWSVAGQLAGFYRILFGISPSERGIAFQPIVPAWAGGALSLTGFRWRKASLDVAVRGMGQGIASLRVNGKAVAPDYRIPLDAEGTFVVEIQMDGKPLRGELAMASVEDLVGQEAAPSPRLDPKRARVAAVLTEAVDDSGEAATNLDITLPSVGLWALRWEYANGSGPVNTDSKCAIRSILVDGERRGSIALPQLGSWSTRGWSSPLILELGPGKHRIGLERGPMDGNMDGRVNRALLFGLEALPLER